MELTKEQLKQLLPKNPYIDQWHKALSQLLPDYEINTPQRIASFIAQCAHESGGFVFLTENLNYKAESLMKIFGKYFPDMATAKAYEKKPEKIVGRCRRHAPTMNGYPAVYMTDWCGDHKLDENKA